MTPFSGLGIGLSLVFGCFLFALVAELYYFLWWKKRTIATKTQEHEEEEEEEDEHRTRKRRFFFYLLCWRRPSSVHNNSSRSSSRVLDPNPGDPELGSGKDLIFQAFGEEGVESELMRLHNLSGPPRFLFTIKEETKEDLETDSVKSRRRSLGDLIMAVDSPFLTPLPSPMNTHHGISINPLFESSVPEMDLAGISSSPPPKFKFLRDAEEKLFRKLKQEAEKVKMLTKNQDCGDGSFVAVIVPSTSSQVLHLPSSPTTHTPTDQKPPIVH